MPRHEAMVRELLTYRSAFLYELPLDGEPHAGGAVCAILADVARRFQPFLATWRRNMTIDGEAAHGEAAEEESRVARARS